MSDCELLVLGSTGLAGRAIMAAAGRRALSAIGVARRCERSLDVCDGDALASIVAELRPRIIVNAVAVVSVADCERDPARAWLVNTRPAALLAEYARGWSTRIVHISTDHYYSGDGRRVHHEAEPVALLNEYARTKYAAELLALSAPNVVVLRTNIVGLHSANGNSFGEWATEAVRNDSPVTLFDDQFVSSIDVWSFAEALLDIALGEACGILNVASSQVFSKAEFVSALAHGMRLHLSRARFGSVADLGIRRPDSLGLDVSIASKLLGRSLPGLNEVTAALCSRLYLPNEGLHALEC